MQLAYSKWLEFVANRQTYQVYSNVAELYIVRHAQASFGSSNYDQLSELGYRQSRWLGQYFHQRDIYFIRIICGEMTRHRQTAEVICEELEQSPPLEAHPGFNEFDFKALLNRFCVQFPEQAISDWQDKKQIYRRLRQAMLAWAQDRLLPCSTMESWGDFQARVSAALDFARRSTTGRTLILSSGGAISMAISQLMGFGPETLVNLNLQSRNSAITHCIYTTDQTYVTGFNQVPHLDTPERLKSISYS